MSIRHEIRLCGFGGQGIILAGHIIGEAAAIFEHRYATFIQDYGPEARGGAARADVVVSDERILYPYIETPTVLVAMSQPAYDKYYHQTNHHTLVIIDEDLVRPVVTNSQKLLTAPTKRIAEELGRIAVANSVMLGFFTAATDIVSSEAIKKAIQVSVPKHTIELNIKAFELGYSHAIKQKNN